MSKELSKPPVRVPLLGRRSRNVATWLLVSSLILIIILSSIGSWLPGIVNLFGNLFSSTSSEQSQPSCLSNLLNSTTAGQCPTPNAGPQWNPQSSIGADAFPKLSLPKTIVSSLDSQIGEGGVLQASSQNLTVYNLGVSMRLLGGPTPHDQLLQPNHAVLSNYSFWSVQVKVHGQWLPLLPTSNNFTNLGTNRTGTFVARIMEVGADNYTGTLKIVYKALSTGSLKWDLYFYPDTTATYRLVYNWQSIPTLHSPSLSSRHYNVTYGDTDYTLAWDDIPSQLNATAIQSHGSFMLSVDLGMLKASSSTRVDPSISSNVSSQATALSWQRHVFYDSATGNYWVFYFDGSAIRYKYSPDGLQWLPSTPFSMPSGWPGFTDTDSSSPAVVNYGSTVIVAAGLTISNTFPNPWTATVSVYFAVGTITSNAINWQADPKTGAVVRSADQFTGTCNNGTSSCSMTVGMRYVDVAVSSDGYPVFTYEAFEGDNAGFFGGSSSSFLYAMYNGTRSTLNGVGYPFPNLVFQYRSAIVQADSAGGMRVVYQGAGFGNEMRSRFLSRTTLSGYEEVEPFIRQSEFSAVSDSNYGTHVVYRGGSDGNVTYAYRPASGSWTHALDIFSGPYDGLVYAAPSVFPTLTIDYSTNDVYVFAILSGAIFMRIKPLLLNWSDAPSAFPITKRSSPKNLGSNLASVGNGIANQVALIWTEGTGPYNATFGLVPIQTVWSPYTSPSDPWDGNGLAPYGQYISNLGEYVSPSTGMLTVKQTDLSLPGRGLNLAITRLYTEPYTFLNSVPYNYETYPWAPMGAGWQLNFPWLNNTSHPRYIHLSDGEGYRIPSSFWTGFTATFENHQGESFRLVRYVDGTIILYDKSGASYSFGTSPNHALRSMTDSTGNNAISFTYNPSGMISCISDTVGRTFSFTYSGSPQMIQAVTQISGSCSGSPVRSVLYGNNGQSLTSVTDPANRITTFSYGSNPWLLTRITYATGWYDAYTYTSTGLGIQATSYRVSLQQVMASPTSPIRQFAYSYAQSAGDQITYSTVTNYNGTQPVSYTKYGFSFFADVKNVIDANGNLLSGDEQFFGTNGQIPREVVFVSDGKGNIGSYTNYYGYDLWGNRIYSRAAINPPASYHESFNSYYGNGEPPGFYAFQDSFGRNQGTAPDNSWNVTNGNWLVNNGVYNGAPTRGPMESVVAYSSVNRTDVSIQASVDPVSNVNTTAGIGPRFGIFSHYKQDSLYHKWALVVHGVGSSSYLELLDENMQWLGNQGQPGGQSSAVNTCSSWTIPLISTGTWYTFNMTVHGTQASGWVSAPGQPLCSVTGTFQSTSPALNGVGFGLYASTYSALFDDVRVATVSQFMTGSGFSNSFIQNGVPGPVGLNTWLATTKPPGNGWNSATNWLPASGWSQAYASQNYGIGAWGNLWGTSPSWPDSNAQWIWWDLSANTSASADPVWFRRVFTVPAMTNVNIAITADDTYVLYLDGSQLGSGNWANGGSLVGFYPASLSAGYHVLGIYATNPNGPDPGGLLVSVKTLTGNVYDSGSATRGTGYNTGSVTVSLPVLANELMIAGMTFSTAGGGSASNGIATITDSQGLTWKHILNSGITGGDKGIDTYYAVATSTGTETIMFTPASTTYKSGFVTSWGTSGATVDVAHAVSTCAGGFTSSIITTVTTASAATIGVFSANDGQINSASGPGTFHFDFYNTGPNGVTVNVDDAVQTSSGTYTDTWTWPGSTYDCTVAVPINGTGNSQIIFRSDNSAGPVISALAGSAQLQNGPGSPSEETYYGYNTLGGLSQVQQLYTSPSGPQWLTTSRQYDSYGNLKTLTDARGNSTSYGYSPRYQSAYVTSINQTLPAGILASRQYSYNFATGTILSSVDGNGYNTTYQYDLVGRTTRITYPTGDYTSYTYNDAANYVNMTNENGLKTRQVYDGLSRLVSTQRILGSGSNVTEDSNTGASSQSSQLFNSNSQLVNQLSYGGSNRNFNDASDTAIIGVCFVAAKGGNIADTDFWLGGSSGITGSVVAQVYSTTGSIPNYPSAGNGCAGKSSLLATSTTSIDMTTLSMSGAQRVSFSFNSGSITSGQEYIVAIKATFTNTAYHTFVIGWNGVGDSGQAYVDNQYTYPGGALNNPNNDYEQYTCNGSSYCTAYTLYVNSGPGSGIERISTVFSSASPYDVQHIQFRLESVGNPTGSLYAEIYGLTGTEPNAVPTGSALATSLAVPISSIGSSFSYLDFAISGGYYLTSPNTDYAIVLDGSHAQMDGSNYVLVSQTSTVGTKNAASMIFGSNSWTANSGISLNFKVSGNTVYYKDVYSASINTYNWMNKITATTDPLGNTYSYQYDTLGRLTQTTKPDGTSTQVAYNDLASWILYTDESGNHRCDTFDRLGRLLSVDQFSDSNCNPLLLAGSYYVTNYSYDEAGNLLKVTSNYNYLTNPGFETGDFAGWTQTGMQVPGWSVHSGKDSAMPTFSNGYYNAFTLQQNLPTALPGSQITSISFWYLGSCGSDTAYVLYSDGTSSSTVLSVVGVNWVQEYLSFNSTKTIIGIEIVRPTPQYYCTTILDDFIISISRSTVYSYDNLNRLTRTGYPDSTLESYGYDSNSNMVSRTNRNGTQTSYAHDSLNRIITTTYNGPTSATDSYTYDNNNNLLQLQSQNATLAYTYDSRNRMLTELYTVNTGYDITAKPTSIVVVAGYSNSSTLTLTSINRFAGKISLAYSTPPGITVSLSQPNPSLSPAGTTASTVTVSAGITTTTGTYTLTVWGNSSGLIRSVTFSVKVIGFSLMVSPNPVGVQPGNSEPLSVTATSQNGYQASSITLSVSGLPSGVTTSTPPFTPNPIALNSGSFVTSSLTLNIGSKTILGTYSITVTATAGTVIRTTILTLIIGSFAITPSPNPVTIAPGANGIVILKVSPYIGVSDTLTLSIGSGLPSCVSSSINPATVTLPNGGSSTLTLTVGSTCTTGSYTVTVNAVGKKNSQTGTFTLIIGTTSPGSSSPPPPSPSQTISISYKISYAYSGEVLSSITYPDGLLITYSYDRLGRVATVSKSGSVNSYASFQYNSNDQPTFVTFGNGVVASYGYTSLSTPSRITVSNGLGTVLLTLSYSYLRTGPVASVTGNSTSTSGTTLGVNEQYGYDPLQRLTTSQVVTGATSTTASYSYDAVGNMQTQTANGVSVAYSYNAYNDELTASSSPIATTSYSYYQNGNLATKATGTVGTAYSWDAANHLVGVSQNGAAQGVYAYDGQGRRVEAAETTTVLYSYEGTDTLAELLPGVANNDYIYASGLRIASVTSATVSYYHTDALGSTRLITDPSKNIIFSDSYQPYGQDNGSPTGSATYKFTGKQFSQTTGLYYYFARWYDPSAGRFISPDESLGSIDNPQSLNRYAYAYGNPVLNADPDGDHPTNILELFLRGAAGLSSGYFMTLTQFKNFYNLDTRMPGLFSDTWRYRTDIYHFDSKTGKPLTRPGHTIVEAIDESRGERGWLIKLDAPSVDDPYYHLGWGDLGGPLTHNPDIPDWFGKLSEFNVKYGGAISRATLVLAIIASALDIYSAYQQDVAQGTGFHNTIGAVACQAGGWAGAWAGAEAGAWVGGTVGVSAGGVGALVGAPVGGLIGGVLGYYGGCWAGQTIAERLGF